MEGRACAGFEGHGIVADRDGVGGGILYDDTGDLLASGDVDHFGSGDWPDGGDGVEVAIAPGFVAAGGKGERSHTHSPSPQTCSGVHGSANAPPGSARAIPTCSG